MPFFCTQGLYTFVVYFLLRNPLLPCSLVREKQVYAVHANPAGHMPSGDGASPPMGERKIALDGGTDKASLVNDGWIDSVLSGDPNGRASGLSSHPEISTLPAHSAPISIVGTTPRRPIGAQAFRHVTLGEEGDEPGESQDFDDLIMALKGEGEINHALAVPSEGSDEEESDVAGGDTLRSRRSQHSHRLGTPRVTLPRESGASTPVLADMEAGFGEMRRISMADTHL